MNAAGKAISDLIVELNGDLRPANVLVLSGKGNNGGDGFAAATWLKNAGMEVDICLLADSDNVNGDAKHFYEKCLEENIPVFIGWDLPESDQYTFAIDAYLGTGFSGELSEPAKKVLNWLQDQDLIIVSADIPSGVDANTGTCTPGSVVADYTVTMGEAKIGLFCWEGCAHAGEITVADIGFPENVEFDGIQWEDMDISYITGLLKPPAVDTNKVRQGKVLIVGGSRGMTGAAILAGRAALKSGAGLVINAVPGSLNAIFETNLIEVMTRPVNDNGKGYLDDTNFPDIEPLLDWCDSLVLGPGIGREPGTGNLIEKILKVFEKSVVVDADGLYFYNFNQRNHILTPHPGEFKRIFDASGDKISRLNDFMGQYKGVLVYKDSTTMSIAGKRGIVNTSGHQGLATAGSGDVLAGMIGSFLAQGFEPLNAASMAVYLHGYSADLLLDDLGFRGLNAADIIDTIPYAISEFELQSL